MSSIRRSIRPEQIREFVLVLIIFAAVLFFGSQIENYYQPRTFTRIAASVAILVSADDGSSPRLRLDALGRHTVAAGSSQKAIFECLVSEPLDRLGLRLADVDTYATELHNPEVTEPAGSGNVPQLNYRVIAGLAALRKEITPAQVPSFATQHGLPGYAPTQGHIASAIPFLGHAVDGLRTGQLQRVMLLAKGSLFLGRMTQMADGLSLLLERNGS